jgi:hypothetical protein
LSNGFANVFTNSDGQPFNESKRHCNPFTFTYTFEFAIAFPESSLRFDEFARRPFHLVEGQLH